MNLDPILTLLADDAPAKARVIAIAARAETDEREPRQRLEDAIAVLKMFKAERVVAPVAPPEVADEWA